MNTKPKILLFDIETMAGLGWFWQMRETNILSVKRNWYMIAFAYKWYGESKVHGYTLPDFPLYKKDKYDDKELCYKLWELMNDADIVIAHYGDSFDIKKANARFIFHKFKPIPPLKSVDTRKVASRHFNFGSNKLDDLAKYFNIKGKHHTGGWQLWLNCAEYDKKEAWKTMKSYNKQDVVLLEQVYLKLRPWIQRHPNIGLISSNKGVCSNCGGNHFQKHGFGFNVTTKYVRLQCQSCGAWNKGDAV